MVESAKNILANNSKNNLGMLCNSCVFPKLQLHRCVWKKQLLKLSAPFSDADECFFSHQELQRQWLHLSLPHLW